MGIDISKLEGTLKTLAGLSDSDKNGKIEGEKEASIFKGYANSALENGQITETEYKNIFGLETKAAETKSVEIKATNPMSRKERRAFKKEANDREDAVKESVTEMVKNNVKPQELMKNLKKQYPNPEYQLFISEVELILNAVNSTAYNSKDDVEKIYDQVKSQLKNSNNWDGFHKDILKTLVEQAESNQINKEYNKLVERYSQIKSTMANTDIVKNQGDNFKAYAEILKDELQTKGADGKKEWNKSYTKEAFELLEEYAKDDAKSLVESRMPNTEGTSARKIKKELNAQNKGGDDYQTDAIKELKTDRKVFARRNTVEDRNEEISKISREDLKDQLGRELFEKLNRSYLPVVRNTDGTYDLTKLSDAILTRVGADYQLNQSKDHEMAELTNVQRHLKSLGIDVTEKEAKKLVEFCDFKREKRDRSLKALGNKILGGIPGAIAGGLGAYSSTKTGDINVDQTVRINIVDSKTLEEITSQLTEKGIKFDTTKLSNGTAININQHVLLRGDDAVMNALKGAGAGAIIGALWGLCDWVIGDVKDEKSCMSISDYDKNDPKYTDAEKYKEYISETYKNPDKVKSLHLLVDAYKEAYGDNWHEEFWNKLREMAGFGSKFNPEECRMMKYAADDVPVKPHRPEATEPDPVPVTPSSPCEDEEKCDASIDSKYTDTTFTYTRKGGDTWKEIVKAFYPCLEEDYGMFGKDGAIRRLKKALSYNEDGTFNQETYKALLEGGDLPKTMRLPAKIDGCDRVDNAKVKKVKVHGGGKAKIQTVGNGSGYYTYTAEDGCDGQTATGSTRQEALANLKKQTGKEYTNENELLK